MDENTVNQLFYSIWTEWAQETRTQERDIEALQPILDELEALNGKKPGLNSPVVIAYECFINGVMKGLELYPKLFLDEQGGEE